MLLAAGRAALDRTAAGGCPHVRSGVVIKKKRAAPGRRSGNHHGRHRILKYFRERRAESPEANLLVFAFCSPSRILLLAALVCQEGGATSTEGRTLGRPFVRRRLLPPPPSVRSEERRVGKEC